MKNFLLKHSKGLAAAGAVGVALAPLSAFAAFSDGMVIPSGTTTLVTSAFTTYFFPTVLATIFQNQVIEIVVVCAAVYIMWHILRSVWGRIHGPA